MIGGFPGGCGSTPLPTPLLPFSDPAAAYAGVLGSLILYAVLLAAAGLFDFARKNL